MLYKVDRYRMVEGLVCCIKLIDTGWWRAGMLYKVDRYCMV